MLDIFFSNKIPSTLDGWTDELIRVASIHNEFDGSPYDYEVITDRFSTISKRVPGVRDSSDYRDEYGAYVSYLGLMGFAKADKKWTCQMNPQAKELLCGALPDPQAFVRLQMSLFQYPNPIGASYSASGGLRIEHLSLDKRYKHVQSGVRTIPFRLFLRVLLSLNNDFDPSQAYLSYEEIWNCLFTQKQAISTFDPDGKLLAKDIMRRRKQAGNKSGFPTKALRNLHILNHTGLIFQSRSDQISLVPDAANEISLVGKAAKAIAEMTSHFEVPNAKSGKDTVKKWTEEKLYSGEWADYYCGNQLSMEKVKTIVEPVTTIDDSMLNDPTFGPGAPLQPFEKERQTRARRLQARAANPEESEALREKANLQHRNIVNLLADRLRARGRTPESNIFIDLCCLEPKKMLFEVKSCNSDNLLHQVRKGISQLYEYRYRHQEMRDAKLVLALEKKPSKETGWLTNYLIKDRSIALCWLEGETNLACPSACEDCLAPLVDRLE